MGRVGREGERKEGEGKRVLSFIIKLLESVLYTQYFQPFPSFLSTSLLPIMSSITPLLLKPASRSILSVQNIRHHVVLRHNRPTKENIDLGSRFENACLSFKGTVVM